MKPLSQANFFAQILAQQVMARFIGSDVRLDGVAYFSDSQPNKLSFLLYPQHLGIVRERQGGCLVLNESFAAQYLDGLEGWDSFIVVPDAQIAWAIPSIFAVLKPKAPGKTDISSRVQIHPSAIVGQSSIGDNTQIDAFSIVEDGVCVGKDCSIGPHVVLKSGTIIGNRVHIQSGCVIGSNAFVMVFNGQINQKVPSFYPVVIKDDVVLGANCCIDAGILRSTTLHQGCMLDNLVQIGHDVELGAFSIVCAQAGIAGFATIGQRVCIGGQAGIAPHTVVEDGAQIAAQAGVHRKVAARSMVSGSPAVEHAVFLRSQARLKKLGIKRVRHSE